MATVTWMTCGDDGHWCALKGLSLDSIKTTGGVYIIWHAGNPPRVVRVGQGSIRDRLATHRKDLEILAYTKFGTLHVTWATVPAAQQDGIERYLAEEWNPLVGDAFPDVQPIAVNSPWD